MEIRVEGITPEDEVRAYVATLSGVPGRNRVSLRELRHGALPWLSASHLRRAWESLTKPEDAGRPWTIKVERQYRCLNPDCAETFVWDQQVARVYMACVEAADETSGVFEMTDARDAYQARWRVSTATGMDFHFNRAIPELRQKGYLDYDAPPSAALPRTAAVQLTTWRGRGQRYIYVLATYVLEDGRYIRPGET